MYSGFATTANADVALNTLQPSANARELAATFLR